MRKPIVLALQIVFAAAVVAFAVHQLAPEWSRVGEAWSSISPNWGLLLASAAIVLASYALLIAVWVSVVRGWGSTLAAGTATRIWFVSNLGKYVPGKIWQIAAMGAMAQRAGVPTAVAVGSSLMINVIHILAGVVVVLLAASDALRIPRAGALLLAALAAGVVLAPKVLPRLVGWVASLAGRELSIPALGYAVVLRTFVGCAVAWVMYGVAFQLLAMGTLPDTGGATRDYIALFTSSYIAGYITPWAPGGIGVRESVLVGQMEVYGLSSASGALVLAAVSRVWLTVLELLPGLWFLLSGPRSGSSVSDPGASAP